MNEPTTNTIPVSEGAVTISLAEYRGLIEGMHEAKAAAKITEAENTSRGARLYDMRTTVEQMNKRIAELEKQAADFGAYLDAVPYRRSEYEMFLRGQALDRLAAEVETK